MKLKPYFLVVFFTVISFSLFAQNDSTFLRHTANSLAEYANMHPVEKVYLHLDRNNYEPGDTIWFKAYLVTGENHSLSAISDVLYVEFIRKDSLLKRLTLPVNNGLSYGDFVLPVNDATGACRIRAYTNWMRNDDADYFYNQTIQVGLPAAPGETIGTNREANITIINGKVQPKAKEAIDVQFFPEGGDLVTGLRSKIAVKAVNHNGFGEDISGVIFDNDNKEVASFDTQHLGMGAFALFPQEGKTYKAKITGKDSAVYNFDLPKAKDEGYTLALNAVKGDSLYLKVAANEQLFKKLQNSTFYVIAQQNGSLCYTAAAKLVSPVFTAAIAKSRFKTGILQFTLFSSSGEAINERVVFVQNDDQLNIAMKADSVYKPWQKMSINLDAENKDKQPATGSFSVSVTDESKALTDDPDKQTIFTHLLLTSDLKGYIEDPGYYFKNVNDKTRADIDLLMLTQGYRKLLWKQVPGNIGPAIVYPPEKGLDMEGVVLTSSGEPVMKGKVMITSIIDRLVIDTLTAADGSFKFINLVFADTAKIVIKARKANNGKNVAIYIKQRDYPVINKTPGGEQRFLQDITSDNKLLAGQMQADTGIKNKILKEVNINASRNPKPDKYNAYGSAYEYDVNLAQLKDFAYLKDAIASKIPGVSTGSRGILTYDGKPLTVMINGLRRDQDDLNIYDLSDIESIRVIDATLRTKPLLMVTTHPFTAKDSIHIKLKEVQIRDKKIAKPDKSNAYGTDAPYTITAARLKDMGPDLNPGLASKIPGAIYSNGVIKSVRPPYPLFHIVLNGHELPQLDGGSHYESNPYDINNYVNTDEVENIKILHGAYYKSVYGILYNPAYQDEDDIILITTKQYAGTATAESMKLKEINLKTAPDVKYVTSDLPTGLITYKFKGYYKAREFYSPKYDDPKTIPNYDPRTTVFWEPGIVADKDGHATFEYFNTGNKGTYRVVIEGIDNNGNLGRQVFRYKVE